VNSKQDSVQIYTKLTFDHHYTCFCQMVALVSDGKWTDPMTTYTLPKQRQ